jgi:hypothetical protein
VSALVPRSATALQKDTAAGRGRWAGVALGRRGVRRAAYTSYKTYKSYTSYKSYKMTVFSRAAAAGLAV